MLLPARSPSSPFGKARKLRRREHGTPDPQALPLGANQAAVRSAPGRDRAGARPIGGFVEKATRHGAPDGQGMAGGQAVAARAGERTPPVRPRAWRPSPGR